MTSQVQVEGSWGKSVVSIAIILGGIGGLDQTGGKRDWTLGKCVVWIGTMLGGVGCIILGGSGCYDQPGGKGGD